MFASKYLSIFSRQIEAIVYIFLHQMEAIVYMSNARTWNSQLFRLRLSHRSVKAYATMPIGIMGSKSLALLC